MPRLLLALAFSLVLLAPRPSAQSAGDYVIGPQDVLTIAVFDQTDLGGKFAVELDGSFTFPLIGRVKAGGLTIRDFEAQLKARLADGFFRNPQVTVAIEQYRSQRVFVTGEVRNPGSYALTGDMTLIEALARAGSTTNTPATKLWSCAAARVPNRRLRRVMAATPDGSTCRTCRAAGRPVKTWHCVTATRSSSPEPN